MSDEQRRLRVEVVILWLREARQDADGFEAEQVIDALLKRAEREWKAASMEGLIQASKEGL